MPAMAWRREFRLIKPDINNNLNNTMKYTDEMETESIVEKVFSDGFTLCSTKSLVGDEQLVDDQWLKPKRSFRLVEILVEKIMELSGKNQELRAEISDLKKKLFS